MAKLDALPNQSVISGLRHVIDFYVNHQSCDPEFAGPGIPCARRWPRSPGHHRSPAVEAQWSAFSYAASAWNLLTPAARQAYEDLTVSGGLTARDQFTRYFLSGQKIITEEGEEGFTMVLCRTYRNTDQNIPNDTWTALIFNTDTFDDYNMHYPYSNPERITIPFLGVYLVCAHTYFVNKTGGNRRMVFRLNDTTDIAMFELTPNGTYWDTLTLTTVYKFNPGDFVTCRVLQNSGSTIAIKENGIQSPCLMVARLV